MKEKSVLFIIVVLFVLVFITGQATNHKKDFCMQNTGLKYGIEGQVAPELRVTQWVNANGEKSTPVKLADFDGKFKVIYCFQAWCPGCHSVGLPSLQKMTEALKGNDKVAFLAIQTVFEGASSNTFERMLEVQKKYDLAIPFGHDVGNSSTRNISSIMHDYKTGGTPWFILINEKDSNIILLIN